MKKENIEINATWTEGPCTCEYDNYNYEIEAMIYVKCDDYKIAINYFKEIFSDIYNVDSWIETMIEKCENGQFKGTKNLDCSQITDDAERERMLRKNGDYRWGVRNTFGNSWKVCLCLSGEYAGITQDD